MSLPDAAAEFARQLVVALSGDAGRADRLVGDGDVRVLRREIAFERAARLRAERQRDELLAVVHNVLRTPDLAYGDDVLRRLAAVVDRVNRELDGS